MYFRANVTNVRKRLFEFIILTLSQFIIFVTMTIFIIIMIIIIFIRDFTIIKIDWNDPGVHKLASLGLVCR